MNTFKELLILCLLVLFGCQSAESPSPEAPVSDSLKHEAALLQLIDFFNDKAYTAEFKTYLSELNNVGEIQSGKVYNVALSRLVYGLSYASEIEPSLAKKASQAVQFQLEHLIAKDSSGYFFRSYFDTQTNHPDSSTQLDIWQQAYGLCGLSEWYRIQPNEVLLKQIHQFHQDLTNRFHDQTNGGFYGNAELGAGQVSGSKTLQSLMYPITAYMENLWLADTANAEKYVPYLKENVALAYQHVWNKEQEWVNVKLDDQWVPCPHPSPAEPCFTVTPGHNFQFASLMLRTKRWTFLSSEERAKYFKLGLAILESTLQKPIFPAEGIAQGFYSEVNPVTNEVIDNRKTWWQHCEALIAFSLAGDRYQKEHKALETFYFNTFPDTTHGGEYFYVD